MRLELNELTKKTILYYVTEEQIFCKYLNIEKIDFSEQYRNTLRTDKNPGCTFFIRQSDSKLMFHDWSQGWIADCFDVVMAAYGCRFPVALEKIAIDFNIIQGNPSLQRIKKVTFAKKPPLVLRVNVKPFTESELRFWSIGGFNITEELLNANKIYSISQLWELRGEEVENFHQRLKMNFMYKYRGQYRYQIYRPELPRSKRRWINSPDLYYGDVEFLNLDEQYVIITKSKKDCFYLRLLGLNAFFIVAERLNLTEKMVEFLNTNFEYIFTLFDNDRTGKKASIRYKHAYGTIPLLYMKDEGKDTSQVLANFGKQYMFDYVEQFKRRYYL